MVCMSLRGVEIKRYALDVKRAAPAEDLAAITVNRWPYGYAYTYDTLADPDVPPEQRPHVIGRQRFGPIAIANSDSGAAAYTDSAIDQAYRAVSELLGA